MVRTARAKPDGGFRFISVVQLCSVWVAYQAKLISSMDLRVWFAAQEMVARRCLVLQKGQRISYTITELHELTEREGVQLLCDDLLIVAYSFGLRILLPFPSILISQANIPACATCWHSYVTTSGKYPYHAACCGLLRVAVVASWEQRC